MRNAKQSRPALSELEHQVMDVLWKLGPSTSEQVREALEPARSLKDSTVRTILRRLEGKHYAAHNVEGRTYIYRVVEQKQNLAVRAVRQIIDRFCGGSVEQLLTGLVDNEIVDSAELQQLARKIAQRKPKGDT